jgi:hypothetical protein
MKSMKGDKRCGYSTSATAQGRSLKHLILRRLCKKLPTDWESSEDGRRVSLWVPRKMISARAMSTGIVAIITAEIPEGTRCSAQNNRP